MCAVTNFRVRHLPSVKRTPARFYFVKSYPFFNPPSAFRPISENLPDRGGLTRGNILSYLQSNQCHCAEKNRDDKESHHNLGLEQALLLVVVMQGRHQ